MWGFVITVLWVLLSLSMVLLMAVILLQEGKGGGLGEAFGGAGAETFGVKATGINRFTAIMGGAFLLLAVLINLSYKWQKSAPLVETAPVVEQPADAQVPAQLPPR